MSICVFSSYLNANERYLIDLLSEDSFNLVYLHGRRKKLISCNTFWDLLLVGPTHPIAISQKREKIPFLLPFAPPIT